MRKGRQRSGDDEHFLGGGGEFLLTKRDKVKQVLEGRLGVLEGGGSFASYRSVIVHR